MLHGKENVVQLNGSSDHAFLLIFHLFSHSYVMLHSLYDCTCDDVWKFFCQPKYINKKLLVHLLVGSQLPWLVEILFYVLTGNTSFISGIS